jgi:hypothetical protein
MAVKAWLIAHGISPRIRSAQRRAHAIAPIAPLDGDALKEIGYAGMVDRLRAQERSYFDMWADAQRQKQGLIQIAGLAHEWRETAELLRKAEKDLAGIKRHAEDSIPRAVAETELGNLAREVRSHLLALPRSLAPVLVGMRAAEIEAHLQTEIRACLTRLSRAHLLVKEGK